MLFKCIKYPWGKQYSNYFSHFLESGSRMPKYLLAMNNVYKQNAPDETIAIYISPPVDLLVRYNARSSWLLALYGKLRSNFWRR